ncbi:MAG TPA: indolepyruvate oxidoreductase subunit beta [Ruminiclostridium sp.]|jgi:indolepyruvate ferredoxin oxidoreductase beta subunit|nr:indolepyruvate oxidoreductase subunit beta [Clostridiaceae bacterium]HAA26090.1 indolepyruvate oxidoreductase subunit beta [Ruminiclostridium sp.]
MRNVSILIAGVGGQGTLLTSQVLGAAAMKAGYDVKMSEVHGMAQRGGSVVTYVRIGENVDSPVIEKGGADILLCFEKLEALRWIDYTKKDGTIIVNDQQIDPMPVIIGSVKYPEGIIEKLSANFKNVIPVKALDAAKELGNIKVLNIVMLGLMAKNTDIPVKTWHEAIRETVKEKFVELNIKAFDKGYHL